MSLPPIYTHYFPKPLPYARTLALQERLHSLQLAQRRASPGSHKDLLLLLQHRPVYTAGRRQTDAELAADRIRLTRMGADFVQTQRGGELTYHGPGQLVGYPLLDLGRTSPPVGIRDYICAMQSALSTHLQRAHGLRAAPSAHTGVFLDERTKVASIGVQVRHRLTSHGFALNVRAAPRAWFDEVVACGLADVRAGSVEDAVGKTVRVEDEAGPVARLLGEKLGREVVSLDVDAAGEVGEAIRELEAEAEALGAWPEAPIL